MGRRLTYRQLVILGVTASLMITSTQPAYAAPMCEHVVLPNSAEAKLIGDVKPTDMRPRTSTWMKLKARLEPMVANEVHPFSHAGLDANAQGLVYRNMKQELPILDALLKLQELDQVPYTTYLPLARALGNQLLQIVQKPRSKMQVFAAIEAIRLIGEAEGKVEFPKTKEQKDAEEKQKQEEARKKAQEERKKKEEEQKEKEKQQKQQQQQQQQQEKQEKQDKQDSQDKDEQEKDPEWNEPQEKYKPEQKDLSKDGGKQKVAYLVMTDVEPVKTLLRQKIYDNFDISTIEWISTPTQRGAIQKASRPSKMLWLDTLGKKEVAVPVPYGYSIIPGKYPANDHYDAYTIIEKGPGEFVVHTDSKKPILIGLTQVLSERVLPHPIKKRPELAKMWPAKLSAFVETLQGLSPVEAATRLEQYISLDGGFFYYSKGDKIDEAALAKIENKFKKALQTMPKAVAMAHSGAFNCDGAAWIGALILRDMLGIPTRIAGGRTTPTMGALRENDNTEYYLVKSSDPAHAWLEVHDGNKWIPFDMTPKNNTPDTGDSNQQSHPKEKPSQPNDKKQDGKKDQKKQDGQEKKGEKQEGQEQQEGKEGQEGEKQEGQEGQESSSSESKGDGSSKSTRVQETQRSDGERGRQKSESKDSKESKDAKDSHESQDGKKDGQKDGQKDSQQGEGQDKDGKKDNPSKDGQQSEAQKPSDKARTSEEKQAKTTSERALEDLINAKSAQRSQGEASQSLIKKLMAANELVLLEHIVTDGYQNRGAQPAFDLISAIGGQIRWKNTAERYRQSAQTLMTSATSLKFTGIKSTLNEARVDLTSNRAREAMFKLQTAKKMLLKLAEYRPMTAHETNSVHAIDKMIRELLTVKHENSKQFDLAEKSVKALPGNISKEWVKSQYGEDYNQLGSAANIKLGMDLAEGKLKGLLQVGAVNEFVDMTLSSTREPRWRDEQTLTKALIPKPKLDLVITRNPLDFARMLWNPMPGEHLFAPTLQGRQFAIGSLETIRVRDTKNPLEKKLSVVYYDVSGSMGGARLETVDALLAAYVDKALSEVDVLGRPIHEIYLMPFSDNVMEGVHIKTKEEARNYFANKMVNQSNTVNGTNIQEVMEHFYKLLGQSYKTSSKGGRERAFQKANMVLLSDGGSEINMPRLEKMRAEMPDKVDINMNFVSIGNEVNPHLKALSENAKLGNGKPRFKQISDEMAGSLTRISADFDAEAFAVKDRINGGLIARVEALMREVVIDSKLAPNMSKVDKEVGQIRITTQNVKNISGANELQNLMTIWEQVQDIKVDPVLKQRLVESIVDSYQTLVGRTWKDMTYFEKDTFEALRKWAR